MRWIPVDHRVCPKHVSRNRGRWGRPETLGCRRDTATYRYCGTGSSCYRIISYHKSDNHYRSRITGRGESRRIVGIDFEGAVGIVARSAKYEGATNCRCYMYCCDPRKVHTSYSVHVFVLTRINTIVCGYLLSWSMCIRVYTHGGQPYCSISNKHATTLSFWRVDKIFKHW